MKQLQRFTAIRGKGWIPPTFYRSMAQPIDPRLPKLTQGLGVIAEGKAKYYPLDRLPKGRVTEDQLGKRHLQIVLDETAGTPIATWRDTREPPRQLLARWYGFSYSYPSCTIYEGSYQEAG
ncbi:MAG: DUF3179 domain-containing protein [Deltaproteobacteria bacterium]|nr:DUF3179 domain-containing protein [Deltaproteobacteria bacterium]